MLTGPELDHRIAVAAVHAHVDGDKIAAWAAEHGHTYRLIDHPLQAGEFSFSVSGTHDGRPFAYLGSGPTKTAAVHGGSAYLRDMGFVAEFSERCDFFACPYCTDTPFPTDLDTPCAG